MNSSSTHTGSRGERRAVEKEGEKEEGEERRRKERRAVEKEEGEERRRKEQRAVEKEGKKEGGEERKREERRRTLRADETRVRDSLSDRKNSSYRQWYREWTNWLSSG